MSSGKEVWTFVEAEREELRKSSLGVLWEGRKLADKIGAPLCALLLGRKVEHLAKIPARYGADKVYLADSESLPNHNTEGYVSTVTNTVKEFSPRIVLFAATSLGKDVAPRVAARLKVGLVTEGVDLTINDEGVLAVRKRVYGGRAHATFVCSPATPQMATIVPDTLESREPDMTREAKIVKVALKIEGEQVEFVELIKGNPRTVSLSEADLIVSVGRGLGKAENITVIQELADLIRASVGGSRGAVDAGWLPAERQVGMTGKTVAPKLYISCGISGQYPHTVAMERSSAVMVINTDRNAPFFKLADIGILGDLNTVVPAISKRIRELSPPDKDRPE